MVTHQWLEWDTRERGTRLDIEESMPLLFCGVLHCISGTLRDPETDRGGSSQEEFATGPRGTTTASHAKRRARPGPPNMGLHNSDCGPETNEAPQVFAVRGRCSDPRVFLGRCLAHAES
jgi:hypothetical protein